MPRLLDPTDSNPSGGNTSNFAFSAVDMSSLGASEYTLVSIEPDRSGSTAPFRAEMEAVLGSIVEACRTSPRADNLLLQVAPFDHTVKEMHGFKPLTDCNPKDYVGALPPGGMTALYDATVYGVRSVTDYGRELQENDYSVNAIVFVITDGDDNGSTFRPADVKKAVQASLSKEVLESIVTVLIGVNVEDPRLLSFLEAYAKDAGFTQFVPLRDATPKTLAKLASFISKSISSQSQSLGTGGPSQALTI